MKLRVLLFIAIVASLLTPWPAGSQQQSAPTDNTCGSAVDNCVLKASAGQLIGVYAFCTAACWVMVFNSTAAQSNASTVAGPGSGTGAAANNMVECFNIAANDSRSLTYTSPRRFNTGITVMISSTSCASLTRSTVAFISGTTF